MNITDQNRIRVRKKGEKGGGRGITDKLDPSALQGLSCSYVQIKSPDLEEKGKKGKEKKRG